MSPLQSTHFVDPAHRAGSTIEFLQQNNIDFISPAQWPANSPDLNPLDYSVWSLLEQELYKEPIADLHQLRERLSATWNAFPQRTIAAIINQWRPRLQKCVDCNGGHFQIFFQ